MKQTCLGCKALDLDGHCTLGYRIISSGKWPQFRYRPDEECEKPMTNKAYIALCTTKQAVIDELLYDR